MAAAHRSPRQRPLAFLGLALLVACGAGEGTSERPTAAASAPNVILISLDTLRHDHMGMYGYERDTTPFLDSLADEGLVYEVARTTWTWTLIAHMSMLTGLYPAQHQVWSDEASLAEGSWTAAARLRDRGYQTLGFYHTPAWLEPTFGFEQGFERYESHRNVAEAMEHVEDGLGDLEEGVPLFLFLHLFDIHNAPFTDPGPLYTPPRSEADRFMEGAWELATKDGLDRPVTKQQLWETPDVPLTPEQREAFIALYDACIAHVDARLEEMFQRLEGLGLLENALVIVTSDHGEGLAKRWKKYGGHGGAFEEGMRVPLLVQLPKPMRRTGRIAEPVSHTDIVPTILDVCGLPADPRLVGVSVLSELAERRPFFAQHEDRRVIYQPPWKVMELQKGAPTIYNLEDDPGEFRRNLTAKQKRQQRDLAGRILEWADEETATWFTPGVQAADVDAGHAASMEALGYGGGD